MTQIRQRKVKVQVTSADPSGKVFKGIYADQNYKTLLTSSKVHDFTLNAGQTKELYIRYSQKPVTITFKGNGITEYAVTGSFGVAEVGYTGDVVKTVEFPTDTTPTIPITLISATTHDSYWEVLQLKVNGRSVTLPYSINDATPGSSITVETVVGQVTTTTSTTSSTTSSTTTSTVPPASLNLHSNVGGTVVEVTSDGIDPEEVSLTGNVPSSVVIDMKDAPLVDA